MSKENNVNGHPSLLSTIFRDVMYIYTEFPIFEARSFS